MANRGKSFIYMIIYTVYGKTVKNYIYMIIYIGMMTKGDQGCGMVKDGGIFDKNEEERGRGRGKSTKAYICLTKVLWLRSLISA